MRALLLSIAGVLLAAAHAEDPSALFTGTILPVLKRDCLGCHGEGQTLSKLDLRSREALLRGGARGPAVQPGKPAESLLLQLISGAGAIQMPPGGPPQRLGRETVDAFARWIEGGAPWPQAAPVSQWTYKEEDLWAFRPVKKPAPGWSIDAMLGARLAAAGIAAAPAAGKRTLIRRITFDLTGLPPSPEEVDAFANDRSPQAYDRLIDRLLDSPRYGERQGRRWLDVARYADSSGYSNDFERPNAWRYRDYVIRAFNDDKPYDRFLREQIAGDELFPGDPEAWIATGFLRAGPWEHTGMSVEAVTRQMFLDDVTNGAGVALLGLTLGCARCHDHKFDPIPTRDYYRVQAAFATTEFARPEIGFLARENTSELAAGRARLNAVVKRTQASLGRFDEMARQAAMKKHGVTRAGDLPKDVLAKAVRDKLGVGPAEFEELKLHQKHMQIYRDSLDRFEPKAFAVSSGPIDGATDGGPNLKYPAASEYKAPEVHVLPGGNVQSAAEKVEPGVLSVVARYSRLAEPAIPSGVKGRRGALAQWIASPDNPLTARVMVNRIWQYHFGKGLAADANNFGKMGKKPSHPELLDALASHFVESGWSVKAVHRLILKSDAYRRAGGAASAKDPENALLSFFPPRRLEAEELRDGMLAAAGELSLEGGGPGVFPTINDDVARQPQHRMGSLAPAYRPSPERRQRNRRTVYTFQQRSLADPMVEVFNGANMDVSCERRDSSTLPTQAFALFNGQFAHDRALALADRVSKQAATPAARVALAFRRAFGRAPDAEEKKAALAHYQRMAAHHRAAPPPPPTPPKPVIHAINSELTGESHRFVQPEDPSPYEHDTRPHEVPPETRALADIALALLNSNEFVYVY